MNIYEFAMQMEKDGEKYYRDLAAATEIKGFKTILNMLADEEVKHYNVLAKLNNSEAGAGFEDSVLLNKVKNIFSVMKEEGETFNFNAQQKEFYFKAQQIEEKSYCFYVEKMNEATDENTKAVLAKIAEEEQKHMNLMEAFVDFVTEPNSWLENAEYNNFNNF